MAMTPFLRKRGVGLEGQLSGHTNMTRAFLEIEKGNS